MNNDNLALRPNCLMTKYPLVFLTGPRSLFYYEKLGFALQNYIKAHGYVVHSPTLAFRSRPHRQLALEHWLKQQNPQIFHFILGASTYSEFSELFRHYPNSTYTIIPQDISSFSTKKISVPFYYRMHAFLCRITGGHAHPYDETLPDKSVEFFDRFLDHCIELAENEPI